MRNTLLAALVAAAAAAAAAAALTPALLLGQGSLSMQGLGYPEGELSTRALGTAGALGELDPRSPLNPASIAYRAGGQVYAQYDPEYRTITSNGQTSSTMTARMPNIGGILPVNSHFVIGLSASSFLDRTWQTSRARTQQFGDDTVSFSESLKSEGAITDVALTAAYAVNQRLRFGVSLHTFPGSERLTSNELFADTTRYQNITQVTEVSYSGTAVSAGMIADVLPSVSIALSGRKGGNAKLFGNDSLLTTGNIPDRYAGSIGFTGIPGTTIAIRASHESWSQIGSLSTLNTVAVDANDVSVGLESTGPKMGGGYPMLLRLGIRRRDLPFAVGNSVVQETSFGGGVGIPISYNRVNLDMSLLRENRTGVANADEHAYSLSFGLQVHP
jgi:opacity protein-like surface antigen